MLADR